MKTPTLVLLASLSTLALLASASASSSEAPRRASTCCAGSAAEPLAAGAPLFERVRELAGTWVAADDQGRATDEVVSRVASTAGGQAVVETLFPGGQHEMLSIYHLDGDVLALEHYCVLGNHPRMLASFDAANDELVFTCSGEGLNFSSCDSVRHMHEGRVKRVGDDRLESRWTPWNEGRPEEPARFSLVRVSTP